MIKYSKEMKSKLLTIMISMLLCFQVAFAVDDINVDDVGAGLTPDSNFYFLDTGMEKLSLMLTFDNEKKINKHLKYAVERSKEIDEVKDSEVIGLLQERYQEQIQNANYYKNKLQLGTDIDDTDTQIQAVTQNHLEVLNQTRERFMFQNSITLDTLFENALQNTNQVTSQSKFMYQKGQLVEDIDFEDYEEYIRPFNGDAINLIVNSNNGTITDYYSLVVENNKIYYLEELVDTDYVVTINNKEQIEELIKNVKAGGEVDIEQFQNQLEFSNQLKSKLGSEFVKEYLEYNRGKINEKNNN